MSSLQRVLGPPSWVCLENLQRKVPRRHLYQMPEPPQLASFNSLRREQSTIFQQKTMASDLEVLNSSSSQPLHTRLQIAPVCAEGHVLMKPIGTTSTSKSRDTILRFSNRTLSLPQLCLEILSTNITNRIGDKGRSNLGGVHHPLETCLTLW